MKVKDLIKLLKQMKPNQEIGLDDFDPQTAGQCGREVFETRVYEEQDQGSNTYQVSGQCPLPKGHRGQWGELAVKNPCVFPSPRKRTT